MMLQTVRLVIQSVQLVMSLQLIAQFAPQPLIYLTTLAIYCVQIHTMKIIAVLTCVFYVIMHALLALALQIQNVLLVAQITC
jgi:hypothetical protein